MKKYELTNETIKVVGLMGHTLYRIRALYDFNDVKQGDLGGFVESEDNLSHEGNCWVYDDAKVYNIAKIFGNAVVFQNAEVFDNAQVFGSARVYGNARIFGDGWIYDDARIFGNALVYGNARIFENTEVAGISRVFGNAEVFGDAKVYDRAMIYGSAQVYKTAQVHGNAEICGDARIRLISDYIVFKNWWSSGRFFTWTRSNNMWKEGCFYGTDIELIANAYKDSNESSREYLRVVRYVKSILEDAGNWNF